MNYDCGEISSCDSGNSENPKYAHYRLRGLDPQKFALWREKFLDQIQRILDQEIDSERGSTIGDEGRAIASGLLDFAKAKLSQPGIENERVLAEAAEKFASAKMNLAKARKTSAEAESIEIDNRIKRLRLMLRMTKAMVIREGGEAALLFGQQVGDLLFALEEFRQETRSLSADNE